jgi:hypothetical protein
MDNKGKQMKELDIISKKHRRGAISSLCGVSLKAVTEWFKKDSTQTKHLKKLGIKMVDADAQFYTSEEVKDILDAAKNNRIFGIKVDKNKITGGG